VVSQDMVGVHLLAHLHIHTWQAKAAAAEEEEWKPWDREEMTQRQMSAEARASVLRKAKEFHTRFSAQSGSRFL